MLFNTFPLKIVLYDKIIEKYINNSNIYFLQWIKLMGWGLALKLPPSVSSKMKCSYMVNNSLNLNQSFSLSLFAFLENFIVHARARTCVCVCMHTNTFCFFISKSNGWQVISHRKREKVYYLNNLECSNSDVILNL